MCTICYFVAYFLLCQKHLGRFWWICLCSQTTSASSVVYLKGRTFDGISRSKWANFADEQFSVDPLTHFDPHFSPTDPFFSENEKKDQNPRKFLPAKYSTKHYRGLACNYELRWIVKVLIFIRLNDNTSNIEFLNVNWDCYDNSPSFYYHMWQKKS